MAALDSHFPAYMSNERSLIKSTFISILCSTGEYKFNTKFSFNKKTFGGQNLFFMKVFIIFIVIKSRHLWLLGQLTLAKFSDMSRTIMPISRRIYLPGLLCHPRWPR
jgi:hypothetical protein